jgi:hypothetical protein
VQTREHDARLFSFRAGMRDNQGTNPWRKHSNRVFVIVRDQYISGIKGCVKVL